MTILDPTGRILTLAEVEALPGEVERLRLLLARLVSHARSILRGDGPACDVDGVIIRWPVDDLLEDLADAEKCLALAAEPKS